MERRVPKIDIELKCNHQIEQALTLSKSGLVSSLVSTLHFKMPQMNNGIMHTYKIMVVDA